MANILLVAYLLIVLALIAVILLQRSEGGALGIGGGGGGMMPARSRGNLMTRTTAILGTLFFAAAIGLTIVSELDRTTASILDQAGRTEDGRAPGSVLEALDAMSPGSDLPVPAIEQPAPDASGLPVPGVPAPENVPTDTVAPDAGDLPVPEAPAAPAPEAEPDAQSDTTPAAPTGN